MSRNSIGAAPLVSVVTPFYNSEDTLERCITSVLSQSFADFEYVLRDNRSTDGSSAIARRYADQDRRIRYILAEKHVPKDDNYNRVLRSIAPDTRYCKVVQADDSINPDCLRELVACAQRYPSAGIVGARRLAGEVVDPPMNEEFAPLTPGRELGRRILRNEGYPIGSPNSVLYRADLVRARPEFFDLRVYLPDVDVALELLRTSDFAFCPQVLSYTHRDPASTYGRVAGYFVDLLMRYALLRIRGSQFFEEREAEELLDRVARDYYETLTRAARRPDWVELYRFHRKVLRAMGLRWEPGRLAGTFVMGALRALRRRALMHGAA